jgi:protein arginine kinase activator
VKPVLEDMHAGERHTGKVPKLASKRLSSQQELQDLNAALARAVAAEAYEEAARYRDQIKALEAAQCEAAELGSS